MLRRQLPKSVTAIAAACLLSACMTAGHDFDWKDVQRVRPGMTTDEVTAILGPPLSATLTSDGMVYQWSYGKVGMTGVSALKNVTLVFDENGRLKTMGTQGTDVGTAQHPSATPAVAP